MNFLRHKKIGFIGTGKLARAIIKALISSKTLVPEQIFVSNRSQKKMGKVVQDFGVNPSKSNEDIVDHCDVVFLCMKPQDLLEAVQPLALQFDSAQTVISLAAGITIAKLKKALPNTKYIVRVMLNTPVSIRKAVVGYSLAEGSSESAELIESLFESMGLVIRVEEGDQFEALTVSCGSGPGFIFELMLYWRDWLEDHGFEKKIAHQMTVQTFTGASLLAASDSKQIEVLQDEVASKKGVTHAGLESIRELDLERILRISFEKAVLRDRELDREIK